MSVVAACQAAYNLGCLDGGLTTRKIRMAVNALYGDEINRHHMRHVIRQMVVDRKPYCALVTERTRGRLTLVVFSR